MERSYNISKKARYGLTVFLLCVISLSLAVRGQRANAQEKDRSLILCGDREFAPYSYMYGNTPSGFSVDLADILSAYLMLSNSTDRDIEIKLMPWEKCLEMIKTGDADGLIGVPVYAKYSELVDFSEPVIKVEYAIFVPTDNSFVNSIRSLSGTLVGVRKGNYIVRDLLKGTNIQIKDVDSVPEGLKSLKDRDMTAFIEERSAALYYIQENGMDGLKIVGAPVGTRYDYALGVRKDGGGLLVDINSGISTLRNNGTIEKLRRKWLGLKLTEAFPWKMVFLMSSAITGVMLVLGAVLWVISLNATVKIKTRRIQMMSQKMVEKDKLAVLGKLAGQIAHELRTPLSVINNSAYLLRKEGSADKELFEKRLSVLEDKVKLSSNILESILSYSRVKAQVATTISIKECVEEVIKDIDFPEKMERTVAFDEEHPLMVFMDFHQLYSVFRNLVVNAVQAMGDTGKLYVLVTTSENGDMIDVRVRDTGPGIPEEARKKIFSLFFTSKITGTGLGLPISKSIMETNGGDIILEETGENGTCFLVRLPSANTIGNES